MAVNADVLMPAGMAGLLAGITRRRKSAAKKFNLSPSDSTNLKQVIAFHDPNM